MRVIDAAACVSEPRPAKPLRFCMVTTFYPPWHWGGDAIYIQALARALTRAGHAVEVVHCADAFRLRAPSAQEAPKRDGADEGIVVHTLSHPLGALSPLVTQQTGRPGLKRAALHAILERDFDVIHFHNISLIGGPGVLGMGRAGVKLYTLHDYWLLCPTHILWKNRLRACDRPTCLSCSVRSGVPPQLWRASNLIARQLEHVDLLLAPSAFAARRHRAAGITRPMAVLENFSRFDPGEAVATAQRVRGYFLFVGRVIKPKGIAELVELFVRLPNYELWVAGGGDLLEALQARCREVRNIRFLGAVDASRLPALYAGATATIMASLAPEVLALVMLESFAHGTPVVSLDSGGCGEAVRASGAGIVCRDMAELAGAVHRLAREPALVSALGALGRQAYRVRYSERAHLAAYLGHVQALQAKLAQRGAA
jgi:glycosyltransferase involved in cell wall biosynthesis